MTRAGWLALGGLALGLIGVIGVELAPGPADDTDATGIRPAARQAPRTGLAAAPLAEDHTDAWVNISLARPLFTRDRKPVGEHVAAAAQGPSVLPRLAGIAVSPFGRHAIFAGDDGKPLVISEGGSVGPYTVRSIAPGAVHVDGPEGQRVLSPMFDPNPHPVDANALPGAPTVPGFQPNPQLQPGPLQPGQLPGLPMPIPQLRPPGLPLQLPGRGRASANQGAALGQRPLAGTALAALAAPSTL